MPGRVRTRRQFAQFARPHARGRSGPLRVSYVAGVDGVNVAYAISRKVGSAVVRNRLRRRLRAALDEMLNRPHEGIYLIRCDNQAKELSYDELRFHLIEALGRAGVL